MKLRRVESSRAEQSAEFSLWTSLSEVSRAQFKYFMRAFVCDQWDGGGGAMTDNESVRMGWDESAARLEGLEDEI